MYAGRPRLSAQLSGTFGEDTSRELTVLALRDEHAVTRGGCERHGEDDLRIIGYADPLREVGPGPIEDEFAFAVLFEVRGRHGHELLAPPEREMGWGPTGITPDTPRVLEHVEPGVLDEGRRVLSHESIPRRRVNLANAIEDSKRMPGLVFARKLHRGIARRIWHARRMVAFGYVSCVVRGRARARIWLMFALTLPLSCANSPVHRARDSQTTGRPGASNVARADYVGSDACASCHPSEFAAWEHSPMHRMTRDIRGAEMHAPFDGTRWRFKGDSAVFERRDGAPWLRVESSRDGAHEYRIQRIIGG